MPPADKTIWQEAREVWTGAHVYAWGLPIPGRLLGHVPSGKGGAFTAPEHLGGLCSLFLFWCTCGKAHSHTEHREASVHGCLFHLLACSKCAGWCWSLDRLNANPHAFCGNPTARSS